MIILSYRWRRAKLVATGARTLVTALSEDACTYTLGFTFTHIHLYGDDRGVTSSPKFTHAHSLREELVHAYVYINQGFPMRCYNLVFQLLFYCNHLVSDDLQNSSSKKLIRSSMIFHRSSFAASYGPPRWLYLRSSRVFLLSSGEHQRWSSWLETIPKSSFLSTLDDVRVFLEGRGGLAENKTRFRPD